MSAETVGNEEKKQYYINQVQISASLFDFTLTCGNTYLDSSKNKVIKKELFDMFMSPQHLKSLNKLISRYIEVYEEKFGEIKSNEIEKIETSDLISEDELKEALLEE